MERTPIWQISEARIHKAGEVQTPQKAVKWIQETMEGDNIDRVRIEAKKSDIIPVYIRGWDTYKDRSWTYGGMQKDKE